MHIFLKPWVSLYLPKQSLRVFHKVFNMDLDNILCDLPFIPLILNKSF